jgi:phenylacetate-CoA ligase
LLRGGFMKRQEIYYRAPVWLQNVLVSLYGFYLQRRRFGRGHRCVRRDLERLASLDTAALERLRHDRFAAMVRHCHENVPYYREVMDARRLTPADFRSLEDLQKLPVLEKDTLRTRGADLIVRGLPVYWQQHTSGSTGTPVTVSLDRYTYQLFATLLEDLEASAGVGRKDWRATFAGRLVQPVECLKPPFWRFNRPGRQALFSAYHLRDETLPLYLDALRRMQPREVLGYPSAIYTVAEYALRKGVDLGVRPAAVVTSSETLLAWQRAAIETAFGCRVVDYYGSAECVVFAGQCPSGRYHFHPLLAEVEVDCDGTPARAGEQGRLLCTTLTNRVQPLLRYEIGDEAIVGAEPCACGRAGRTAEAIAGRTDDNIVTPDGRAVGRIDHIFKGLDGIRECQVVQESTERLVLRLVADPAFGDAQRAKLRANVRERLGAAFQVEFEIVERIERSARGKFKSVVSRVNAGQVSRESARG